MIQFLLLLISGDSESRGIGFNAEEESGLRDEVHHAGLQQTRLRVRSAKRIQVRH